MKTINEPIRVPSDFLNPVLPFKIVFRAIVLSTKTALCDQDSQVKQRFFALLFIIIYSVAVAGVSPDAKKLPGVVIDHCPASSGKFIGSPSLLILTNGDYLASHDFFGPKSGYAENPTTVIFRSANQGLTWRETARFSGALWGNLFLHRGAVYWLGVDKEYGRIVIRRSDDGGINWTVPRDAQSGRLTENSGFHTAPVTVVERAGKLWRAFEDANGGTEWGKRYRAGMISISTNANLLVATNWTFSNFISRDPGWLDGDFNGWLEGNAVETRDGKIVDILRVDRSRYPEKAAIVEVTNDGRDFQFSPTNGFVVFPGGAKKFTVRFDTKSNYYWSLASIVLPEDEQKNLPGCIRNTLALIRSYDLHHWEVRAVLLHDPDTKRHGFQYADWQFDGDNIIAVVRVAFDDAEGGAHNYHDANYMTFHHWKNFKELTSAEGLKDNPY